MKRIKVIIPVTTDRWNQPVARLYEAVKEPDTEIEVINLTKGPPSIEAFYDEVFAEPFTVQEVEHAAREGFDGVILYCFGNPGLAAAREVVDIPVVGIGEAAINLASILGHRMAIVVELAHAVPRVWRTVKLMGLADKVAAVRSAEIPVLGMGEQEHLRNAVLRACEQAVEEDQADVLVLGCGAMLDVRTELEARFNVPVVEPGPVALKLVESLIVLNLSHSKRAYRTPPAKEIVWV